MNPIRNKRRGQALVMVSLALIAMFGLIGLAVDFGWAFFVEKAAQSAADSAALAAVKKAFDDASVLTDYNCGGSVAACATPPVPCPSTGTLPLNLQSACLYAAQNGFSTTNPRQNVTVEASDRATPPTVNGCNPLVAHPPTAACVDTYYWVTVRVAENVPQLFSAILGNGTALVSARATAAVAKTEIIGSLILLNRENDPWIEATGQNFFGQGSPVVNVPGGILLSSNSPSAGRVQGSAQVISPFTYVRNPGGVTTGGSASWTAPPTNQSDGSAFWDPFRNKPQPPLIADPTTLPLIPIQQGISGRAFLNTSVAACSSGVCPPGNYYAVHPDTLLPTGTQLEISSDVSFAGTSSGYANFGMYVFWGGVNIGQASVDFGPGQYVFAGVKPGMTKVFDNDNKALLTGTSGSAGRMFLFTDERYEGQLYAGALHIGMPDLLFGSTSIKAGNNAGSGVNLHGLNPADPDVIAAGLIDYPVVFWQDRLNSRIKYLPDGNLDLTCAASGTATGGAPGINNPCLNPDQNRPEFEIWATPNTQYDGVIYQPRGSWTVLQAAGNYAGALRIISGAMKVQGSGNLTLTSPSVPVTQLSTALVE